MKFVKMLVTFIAVFFTAFIGVAQVSGGGGSSGPVPIPQTPTATYLTELPMIMSTGALRAYALNMAREVNAGLNSASIPNGGYDSKVWTGPKTSVEIVSVIDLLKVKGDTVNTSDIVSFYVSVNSQDGDQLFTGYTEGVPVQTNSVWALPATMKNVKMNLAYNTPINLGKQISYATTVSKDSNGNTRFDQLYTNSSKLYFPSQSAGLTNAYVQVNWTDGTSTSYTITTGAMRQAFALEISPTSLFPNVYSFKDKAVVSLVVASQRGIGIVPTIEVVMTNAGSVVFDVMTSEGKRPVKFWAKLISGTTWNMSSGSATGASTIVLPVGTVIVVPEWNSSDFNEASVPISNGGKG